MGTCKQYDPQLLLPLTSFTCAAVSADILPAAERLLNDFSLDFRGSNGEAIHSRDFEVVLSEVEAPLEGSPPTIIMPGPPAEGEDMDSRPRTPSSRPETPGMEGSTTPAAGSVSDDL